jgi:DNA-binding MarR family transcriptional regulator
MITELVRLFDEVRLLEHRLVQAAGALHGTDDVSIPGRAVLEYLQRSGPTSVPDIARARYVTRQHIQATIDGLAHAGLVRHTSNPAHRRSPLFALTETGADSITAMHKRERAFLTGRMKPIDRQAVVAATALLGAVRAALEDEPLA